ncbi:MAG: phage terminase large subunit, partial [Candidatus Thorarchaeota archaeon]
MKKFVPHSEKQERALFSEKKIVLLACGIQFGKTAVGAIWMRMKMHQYRFTSANFLILSPSYKILQQSTLPAFLETMDGLGEYHKGDGYFKMHDGGTCYFRTGTNPDSIVGVTDVYAVYGDECGLYSNYFWQNIQARASFKQAQVLLTTSPYSFNWVYKEFIKPFQKGKPREDAEIIQAASFENPYFPEEEYERKKRTMDPRMFRMIYGGQFEKLEGLVYECFDEDMHVIEHLTLPIGTKYYAGVDWGTSNPFALMVVGRTPEGRYYLVAEF